LRSYFVNEVFDCHPLYYYFRLLFLYFNLLKIYYYSIMSNGGQTPIKVGAMPEQTVAPLQAGATSPGNSAYRAQVAQTNRQMALINAGKTGGSKRRFRGGDPVAVVPPVPVGATGGTGANYTKITSTVLAAQQSAAFDNAKNPGDTAIIQAQQNALYKSGGSRSKKSKRGGAVKWGCLSGGLKRKSMKKYSRRRHIRNKHKSHSRRNRYKR
jgi:hypothetical protein